MFFKSFILSFILLCSSSAIAQDEAWMSFVLKANVSKDYCVLSDYVRRDETTPFQDRFRDLFRSFIAKDFNDLSLMFGAAFADFESQASEFRLIQQAIYNLQWPSQDLAGFLRLGFEQRKFEQDNHWYLRVRGKFLFIPWKSKFISPTIYNESFVGFEGQKKFKNGFNENRFGLGLNFKIQEVETFVFWVNTNQIAFNEQRRHFDWLQIQFNFRL